MNYTVKGHITHIGEVETLSNGASKLEYRIKSDNEYDRADWKFEIYKKPEYAEHAQKFKEFNKVGDRVEVEWNVKPSEWQGKYYINLSHWKCTKLTEEENAIQQEKHDAEEAGSNVMGNDPLPF